MGRDVILRAVRQMTKETMAIVSNLGIREKEERREKYQILSVHRALET